MVIIDMHTHLGKATYPKYSASPEELLEEMDENGIDQAVVFPQFNIVPGDYSTQNDWLSEVVSQHPDRFVGFGRIHPGRPDARKEVERVIDKLGLKGIKLHMEDEMFALTSPGVEDVLAKAEACNVPVVIHVVPSTPLEQLGTLVDKHPSIPIIFAHMGLKDEEVFAGISLAKEHDNLYLEPSNIMYPQKIKEAMAEVGDRVFFGSNFPSESTGFAIERIKMSGIEGEDWQKLMWKNADQFLRRWCQ